VNGRETRWLHCSDAGLRKLCSPAVEPKATTWRLRVWLRQVTTSSVRASSTRSAQQLQAFRSFGCEVTYVPVTPRFSGSRRYSPGVAANYEAALDHDGQQRDRSAPTVEEIGRIAAQSDVYFHTDAVQAAGKVAINVQKIGCDLLSISGHKMHAPQGAGRYMSGNELACSRCFTRAPRAFASRWYGERARNCGPGKAAELRWKLSNLVLTATWPRCAIDSNREF